MTLNISSDSDFKHAMRNKMYSHCVHENTFTNKHNNKSSENFLKDLQPMQLLRICHQNSVYKNKSIARLAPSRILNSKQMQKTSNCSLFLKIMFIVLYMATFFMTTQAFSQGSMIVASFEQTYCQSGMADLDRGPAHYDLTTCGGSCTPRRAPRGLYAMVPNATQYSVDDIQVEIRANGNLGANILGFAVVAISEDGRTAGSWVVDEEDEDPDVLRATCDSLLEGQVIFHARPSNDRRRVVVTWNSRKTNFGRIIFRAWIVQRMDLIFIVDSSRLTNPLNGAEFMSLESHFTDIISGPRTNSQSSPSISRRLPPSDISLQSRSRALSNSVNANKNTQVAVSNKQVATRLRGRSTSSGVSQTNDEKNSKSNNPNSQNIDTSSVPSLSLAQFEEAFLVRLTNGFDLRSDDPFLNFNENAFEISDLLPEPIKRSQNGGSSFGPSLGGSRVRDNGRQRGSPNTVPFQLPQNFGVPLTTFSWQTSGQIPGQIPMQFIPGQNSGANGFPTFGQSSSMGAFGAPFLSNRQNNFNTFNSMNSFQNPNQNAMQMVNSSPWAQFGNNAGNVQNAMQFSNNAFNANSQFRNGGFNQNNGQFQITGANNLGFSNSNQMMNQFQNGAFSQNNQQFSNGANNFGLSVPNQFWSSPSQAMNIGNRAFGINNRVLGSPSNTFLSGMNFAGGNQNAFTNSMQVPTNEVNFRNSQFGSQNTFG